MFSLLSFPPQFLLPFSPLFQTSMLHTSHPFLKWTHFQV
jgi:hypothetical protein